MIPSPALQERGCVAINCTSSTLVSLEDFAALPRRKQVMG